VIDAAEERLEHANAGRRAKLRRVPDPAPGGEGTGQQAPEAGEDPGGHPVTGGTASPSATGGEPDDRGCRPADARPPLSAEDDRPSAPEPGRRDGATEPADPEAVRSGLEGLRRLLAELRAGRRVERYDRGSLRLALRELDHLLADEASSASAEGVHAA
jgi:ParB family chromosome partitioning protein